jgi:branched-chain amino acid transport system permease protein
MQIFVNGIITGLTISVLAMAFSVAYLSTRVFHVALGGVYASVPFIAWTCLNWGWPWYGAMTVATLIGVGLSIGCELINHNPLERKKASSGTHLVSSLGIYIIIIQAVVLIWGNETRVLRTGLDAVAAVGGIIITRSQIIAAVVSVVIIAVFYCWLRFSSLGLQFRALSDNPTEFALRGYNVRRLRFVAFAISGIFCSGSALLVSYDIGFDPHGGLVALLLAVVAVIIGGRQSFMGPVVGGILLGLVRSEVVWFLSARWQEAITFLLLVVFLFVRPNGIFGRKGRLEAEA